MPDFLLAPKSNDKCPHESEAKRDLADRREGSVTQR